MTEQLVSFETTKLAKEKGFSVGTFGCLVHYKTENKHHEDGTSGPFGWKKDEMTFDKSYVVNGRADLGDLSNSSYDCYELPTQSLLQKWLREKHKISVELSSSDLDGYNYEVVLLKKQFEHLIIDNRKSDNMFENTISINFNTYEEALEKGLQEALKLI